MPKLLYALICGASAGSLAYLLIYNIVFILSPTVWGFTFISLFALNCVMAISLLIAGLYALWIYRTVGMVTFVNPLAA